MENNDIELIKYILRKETEGIYLKNQMIVFLIETVLILGIGMILYWKKKTTLSGIFRVYFLVVYAQVILLFTVFRRPLGSRAGKVILDVNLGFTATRIESLWKTTFSILNIFLFIPWGIIISALFKRKSTWKRVLMTTVIGFLTSFLIEHVQLFTGTGMFELTDLMTNTIGGFIGACIAVWLIDK